MHRNQQELLELLRNDNDDAAVHRRTSQSFIQAESPSRYISSLAQQRGSAEPPLSLQDCHLYISESFRSSHVPLDEQRVSSASGSIDDLEREYDRDTWRMFTRIHSARTAFTTKDENAVYCDAETIRSGKRGISYLSEFFGRTDQLESSTPGLSEEEEHAIIFELDL